MPTYDKESMLSQMQSLVGELGNVVDQGDVLLGYSPNRNSLYNLYAGKIESNQLEIQESYKAERDEFFKWVLFIKRGSQWVQVK